MKQLLSAVKYIHSQNIIHGNIKPENILFETELEGSQIKLIGFGFNERLNSKQQIDKSFNNVLSSHKTLLYYLKSVNLWRQKY